MASVSHPAAGASGLGADTAHHPRGTGTVRGWWHPQRSIPMSLPMALAMLAASWLHQGALPCHAQGAAVHSLTAQAEGNLARSQGKPPMRSVRVKPNLKPRQLPGVCELPASSSWEALPQAPGTALLENKSLNLNKVPIGTAAEGTEGVGWPCSIQEL